MSEEATARHALPNLFVGQAQKEVTHNEALARIDALLHPVVQGWVTTPPAPNTTDDGKCWLIKGPAIGVWAGKENHIARWSGGSWRYLNPSNGMALWLASDQVRLFYITTAWIKADAIAAPSGGSVIDVEARIAVGLILGHLRQISNISA